MLCDGSTVAYSSACRLDQFDRPLVGYINFCTNAIDLSDPKTAEYAKNVALHETIHVLGFSSKLFPFFRDEAGVPRTPRCPSAPGCTASDSDGYPPYDPSIGNYVPSQSTVTIVRAGGRQTHVLATPSVALVTRAYFDCAAATGAALESGGSATMSANSHWEMRHLFNELMTAAPESSFPILLTEFSLAALADSGTRPLIPAPSVCDQLACS